jgi:hypothetical protein
MSSDLTSPESEIAVFPMFETGCSNSVVTTLCLCKLPQECASPGISFFSCLKLGNCELLLLISAMFCARFAKSASVVGWKLRAETAMLFPIRSLSAVSGLLPGRQLFSYCLDLLDRPAASSVWVRFEGDGGDSPGRIFDHFGQPDGVPHFL